MSSRRAILSIYYQHKRGGLCERLELLLRHFDEHDWSVHYCSVERFPWHGTGMVHHRVPAPSSTKGLWFWLGFSITAPWVLLAAAIRIRPSYIVVFDLYYAVLALPATWLLGCPLVVSVHADTRVLHRLQGRAPAVLLADAIIEAIGLRWAARVHTVSGALRSTIEARHPRLVGRVEHVPNHIRDRTAPPSDEIAALRKPLPTLITASILDRRKNVGFLLDALAPLEGEPWRLVIVGDGPGRAEVEERVRRHRLERHVEWVGWKQDVQPYLGSADAFLLPSLHEGNPLALLEALGAGLLCLGSDIPEVREVLLHDELLFSLNDPASLTARLRVMLRDTSERERLRALCLARAEDFRFDWAATMYRWVTTGTAGNRVGASPPPSSSGRGGA